ncbi:MAG: hypothetical protein ACLFTK_09715 [Anaerolineales bacterium]
MTFAAYPFGHAALLAGLRRYLGASTLRLVDIHPLPPAPVMLGQYGDVRPEETQQRLRVTIDLDGHGTHHDLGVMLYQAPSEAIAREIGCYQVLDNLVLPVILPGFIAGDDLEGWLVLEDLEDLRAPDDWTVDDYREAVDNLALLHDRFWGLEEDLDNFIWLAQPLARDYAAVVERVGTAHDALATLPHFASLAQMHPSGLFATLVTALDDIAAPLRTAPQSLVHNVYWPGTIARPLDGRQMITHWREAAIGPPMLDLINFYQTTLGHLKPSLPLEAALARYRVQLGQRQRGSVWSDTAWALQWDHALLWNLAVEWLPRLPHLSAEAYTRLHDRLARLWYTPAQSALKRRLGVQLPE